MGLICDCFKKDKSKNSKKDNAGHIEIELENKDILC